MKLGKLFAHFTIAVTTTIATILPLRANQVGPEAVLKAVYIGIRQVQPNILPPRVKWDVRNGSRTPCGRIGGSMYCTRNHTVYITRQHIRMAYQHGDAALAYMFAHEYAHAMQTAGRFMPRNITAAELQADCLAGYYLGVIPNVTFDRDDIKEIATLAHRIGDYEYNNPNHHGTPKQRTQAVLMGLQAASDRSGMRACRIE
jgi:uncharacterized protein